jgi:hypothetical protein
VREVAEALIERSEHASVHAARRVAIVPKRLHIAIGRLHRLMN